MKRSDTRERRLSDARAVYDLLPNRRRRQFWIAVLGASTIAALELISAGLVFAVLRMTTNPEEPSNLPIFGDIRELGGTRPLEEQVIFLCLVLGAFVLLRGVATLAHEYAVNRLAQMAGRQLAMDTLRRTLDVPYEHLSRTNSATLVRNVHLSSQEIVNNGFIPLVDGLSQLIVALALTAVLFAASPLATAFVLVYLGGLVSLLLGSTQRRVQDLGRQRQHAAKSGLQSLQETFNGVREIKLLHLQQFAEDRYATYRHQLARSLYIRASFKTLPRVVLETALILFVLSWLAISVNDGGDAISTIGVFAYASLRLQPAVQRLSAAFNDLQFNRAAISDIATDLGGDSEELSRPVHSTASRALQPDPNAAIQFRDVEYSYPAGPVVLAEVTFTIERGEFVGVCGTTGAGKSTLLDLAIGMMATTRGAVSLNGFDPYSDSQRARQVLGVVPQSPYLIDASLRDNIALGAAPGGVDPRTLDRVAHLADLSEMVAALPEGFDTHVGELGARLSGGSANASPLRGRFIENHGPSSLTRVPRRSTRPRSAA